MGADDRHGDRSTDPERAAEPGDTAAKAGAESAADEHNRSGTDLARQLANRLRGAAGDQSGAVTRSRSARRRWRRSAPTDPSLSGPRADDRDPQLLEATIERLVSDHGWREQTRAHRALAQWDSVVGPQIAEHCKPLGVHATVLTVQADSTAWKTQVTLLAPQIVAKLNEVLGDGAITRVDVRGPEAPSWKHGKRRVTGGRGPRDTYG